MLRNKSTAIRTLVLFSLLIPLSGSNLFAAEWHGTQETTDGVLTINNPAQPIIAAKTVAPKKLWSVGGESDEGGKILGFVTDVQVDHEGNSYLLDSTQHAINVYSPAGEFLREIGSEGEGPGEFRNASEFMLMSDGNFGVIQPMPAKVITLDRYGVPGSYFALCEGDRGLSLIEGAQAAGEYVVIGSACPNWNAGVVDHTLYFAGSDGRYLHTIQTAAEKQLPGNMNVGGHHDCEFTSYFTLSSSGQVFVAPHKDRYQIDVYNSHGELEHVINRQYKTVKRSDEDRAADKKKSDEMAKRFGGMVTLMTREFERDIDQLHARHNGELWVLSSQGSRDCPAGEIGLFDVFDSSGHFDHQIGLHVDFDAKRDDFRLVGDRLYILKQAQVMPASMSSSSAGGISSLTFQSGGSLSEDGDEDDETPPSVICYQLPD